jgi:hypothetical protein
MRIFEDKTLRKILKPESHKVTLLERSFIICTTQSV